MVRQSLSPDLSIKRLARLQFFLHLVISSLLQNVVHYNGHYRWNLTSEWNIFQYLNFKHYCALLGRSLSYSELQMLWSSPDDQNGYLSVLIPTDNWQGVCWYKWGVGPYQAENRDFCHLLPWKPKSGKNLFENRLIYFLSTIQEEFNYITLRSMKFVILLDETY